MLICLMAGNTYSQRKKNNDTPDQLLKLFYFEIDSINELFDSIQASAIDEKRMAYNKRIVSIMEDVLYDNRSFEYAFDSLKWMGKLKSDDGLLKLYTWNLMLSDKTYRYFGFIHYLSKSKNEYFIYELNDQSDVIADPERLSLREDKWYGALYYRIIENKSNRRHYYTLLGWDGNNELTTKKIIDVLYFTQSGKPRFGSNVFSMLYGTGRRTKRVTQKRVMFEYSSKAAMALRYDPELEMIVFDHLSPSSSHLKGNYQYYGPDWSYDALKFDKGKWYHLVDIDPRNPKPREEKPSWEYNKSEDFYRSKQQKKDSEPQLN